MAERGMVIVGGGRAGARAVVSLRGNGWTGPLTLIGDELLAPYDRPPLSKAAITDEAEPEPVWLLDESMIKSLDCHWVAGSPAIAIDRAANEVVLADGGRVGYRALLLATGAGARQLAAPGAGRAWYLRNFSEAAALRAAFQPGVAVAVVGGGFIGLELAASARTRGAEVTVIEAQPRILTRGVTPEIAGAVAYQHQSAGVAIFTGAGLSRIDADAIVLADGRRIAADVVIAGIGAVPEVRLAEAAGLALDNGIACDAHMRTSDPSIFAAGDCASAPHVLFGGRRLRFEAWRTAQDQADVAAENMLGGAKIYQTPPWFWSDQYDLNLQIAGVPGDGANTVTRRLGERAFVEFHLAEDGRLVGASGIGPGNAIARDVKLAELLISKRARPAPAQLADAGVALKALLRG